MGRLSSLRTAGVPRSLTQVKGSTVAQIFISYRRDDSAGWAGRLFDRLSQHFGRENVFMDIDTIEPGLDFVEVIEQAVGKCDALVALIGQHWLTITDDSGRPRLDNAEDFVRLEIAAALARNIRVIPALVQSARMPRSTDLPDILKPLARRNAIEISDRRFHHDVDQLIEVLDKVLASARPATDEKSDVAIVDTPLIAPQPHEESNAAQLPFEPEMILIPAGEFLMGSDPQQDKFAFDDEQPQHTLYLPDYYLARTPVTNAQYSPFVQATGHELPSDWDNGSPPGGKEDHPVVYVSWFDALAYCRWLSEITEKAYGLSSEAEWEKGARGIDGRIYPWGNRWDATRCNAEKGDRGDTTSVGAYPQGASPYGLLDMAGNVWEWTRSLWGKHPYPSDAKARAQREDLQAPDDQYCVVRGGAFVNDLRLVRCAYRYRYLPSSRNWRLGFRLMVRPAS